LKVIFIAGASRTGSTILSQILGQVEYVCSPGELAHIWDRGLAQNRLCGCGKSFGQCAFWEAVVQDAFPNDASLDLPELTMLTESVQRFRFLPFHLFSAFVPRFRRKVEFLASHYLRIYESIERTTGTGVFIDSSKHIHGYVLSALSEIELYVIHMVRDPRATAHSWSRKKVWEEQDREKLYFPRIKPATASVHWIFDNISAELLRRRVKNFKRIRYEDFARNPRSTLKSILEFSNVKCSKNIVSNESTVVLSAQHSVSGNSSRFKIGETLIMPDDQWKEKMPKNKQLLVAFLTLPFLFRYGYFRKGKDRN
jgi:hypothetical protein